MIHNEQLDIYNPSSIFGRPDNKLVALVKSASSDGGLPVELFDFIKSGNQLDGVVIKADNISDYSLLADYQSSISKLRLNTSNIDWSVLSKLKNLKSLTIDVDVKECEIYFGQLDSLKHLYLHWSSHYLDRCRDLKKLISLTLENYKQEDLSPFLHVENIKYLSLVRSKKIKTLSNIENFSSLLMLKLVANPSLENILSLVECKSLKHLHFENNNKTKNVECIAKILNLSELVFCSKKISNLTWMADAINLQYLRFTTQLENGNIDFLKDMPKLKYLFFTNRKNFSLKLEGMVTHLSEKGYEQEALQSKHLTLNSFLDY